MSEPDIAELLMQRSNQAKVLRLPAGRDGLRFECHLPPALAAWILDKVEGLVYEDPAEAVRTIVNNHVQLCRLERVREKMEERALARSAGKYFRDQTLEEVAQSLTNEDDGKGVPAYWHNHGGTEQFLSRADHDFVISILFRFSTYSEATHWYLSRSLPGFGGATAAALVREGRAEEVAEYLDGLDAGIFA